MSHQIDWAKQALNTLSRLDPPTRTRIISAVDDLATTGRGDIRRLEGSPQDAYRLRVGGWRVIFAYLDDTTIFILRVGSRGDIYKR